jgi:hypothetical protein
MPGGDPLIGSETFSVQNGRGGLEHAFSPTLRVNGSIGFAQLRAGGIADRTGLAWRAGVSHRFERTMVTVAYSRSFTPAYGFGGTSDNEELMSRVRTPIRRRLYTDASIAWRRNSPLTGPELRLGSVWIEGRVGYALAPWMQIEGFYNGIRQSIDRPGGRVDRNRVGFQVITAKPVRIR